MKEQSYGSGASRDAKSIKAAVKRWWGNKIRIRTTAAMKVMVTLACVDDIVWVQKEYFKVAPTITAASVGAAFEYAVANEATKALVTKRPLEAGQSHAFTLATGTKAYVTITSFADETQLFCEHEVVKVPWTLKANSDP